MSEFKNFAVGVFMLALAGYGAVKASMYFHARYRVNALLAPLSRVAKVNYDDVTVSLFGPVGITGLSIVERGTGARMTVERAIVHEFEYERHEPLPRRLYLTLDGVHLGATLMREGRSDPPQWVRRAGLETVYRDGLNVAGLGYDEVAADVELDLHYEPVDGAVSVRYRADASDMGDLELKAAVVGFTPQGMRRGLPGLRFRSASLDYRDASFVRRLMTREAQRHQQPLATFQQGLVASLDEQLTGREIKLDAKSVQALKHFLLKPRHLVITMRPYEPVPLKNLRFYKPGDIPMLLNTEVSN